MSEERHIIELIDKYTSPLEKAMGKTEAFEKKVNQINRGFNEQRKSVDVLRGQLDRYTKARNASFRTDHIERYNRMIQETQRRIHSLTTETEGLGRKTDLLGTIGKKALLAFASAGGALMLANKFVSTSRAFGEMEKYTSTTESILKSRGASRGQMADYSRLALETTMQLPEVVATGNRLLAMGSYSPENVKMIGDLAAVSEKPIEQVLNAYQKLASGQKGEGVNMFRDLLISNNDWAKATGATFGKNGELNATTDQMIAALPKIMEMKGFLGMMEKQAQTTEGHVSNLKDALFQMNVAMGERNSKAFKSFLTGATNAANAVRKWVEIPLEKKLRDEITEIRVLDAQLRDTNTSEQRRLDILTELERINPSIVDGIDKQNVNYSKLASNINEVVKGLEKQIILQAVAEEEATLIKKATSLETRAQSERNQVVARLRAAGLIPEQGEYNLDEVIDKYLPLVKEQDYKDAGMTAMAAADMGGAWGEDGDKMHTFEDRVKRMRKLEGESKALLDQVSVLRQNAEATMRGRGYGSSATPPPITGSTGGGSGLAGELYNLNQLSGSQGAVRNVHLTIGSLIQTNQNIFEDSETANPEVFMEKLKAALITVLNDVNNMN